MPMCCDNLSGALAFPAAPVSGSYTGDVRVLGAMGNQLAQPQKLQSDHITDFPNVVLKDILGKPLPVMLSLSWGVSRPAGRAA